MVVHRSTTAMIFRRQTEHLAQHDERKSMTERRLHICAFLVQQLIDELVRNRSVRAVVRARLVSA